MEVDQKEENETNNNELIFQQIQKLMTYQSEINEGSEQELGIEPELLQKLKEFCSSEDREQMIQQLSHPDLINLLQLADQLQRTQNQQMSEKAEGTQE